MSAKKRLLKIVRFKRGYSRMAEVLLKEEYVSPERRDDRREVINYIVGT